MSNRYERTNTILHKILEQKLYGARRYLNESACGRSMDEERTTRELIETLGEDYDRCFREILKSFDDGTIDADGNLDADYEFHARQLVRAVFAYIKGVTFSVKVSAAWKCMQDGVEITPQERYIAAEIEYRINDKGEVVEHRAQITLTRNIRFAVALTEKAHRIPAQFDPSVEWWLCLREAMKVRDRLMHPRRPEDLDISPEELIKAITAKNGFEKLLMRYIELDAA